MKYARGAWVLGIVLCLGGCGDDDPSLPQGPLPTPTATAIPTVPPSSTSATGPVITFIGITRADDGLVHPVEISPEGVPIYTRLAGTTGGASGFRLVVEGKPGTSGAALALSTFNMEMGQLPDLQIQVNRPLGNGSAAVCDSVQPTPGPGTTPPGGVPAIDPPNFTASLSLANTINDLACRFRDGLGDTSGIGNEIDGCVKMEPTEDYGFVSPESTSQFCGFVSAILQFPRGDTLVSVRLRDVAGNVGAPAQMVIRVN